MSTAEVTHQTLPFVYITEHVSPDEKAAAIKNINGIKAAVKRLLADHDTVAGFLDVPGDKDALLATIDAAAEVKERFSKVLVLGIGGSGLGTKAAMEALSPLPRRRSGRDIRVLDNLDPVSVNEALAWFDPSDTFLNPITKSGTTVETLSQFAVFAERIASSRGDAGLAEGVLLTTDPDRGTLRRIAEKLQCATLDVPPLVGGRFSVLTPVGLFPISLAGYDVAKIMDGARAVRDALNPEDPLAHPSVLSAAIEVERMKRGAGVRVFWAYCDRLRSFGDWFVQLWAESLGKQRSKEGVGQTPIRAIGSTDQHSLLQLLMEGPNDKSITILTTKGPLPEIPVPDMSHLDKDFAEFADKEIAEVFTALRLGTMAGLVEAGRPPVEIEIAEMDERAVGALFMHFEIETAVAGYLMDIDPFNQPGVEAGKKYAHGLLGKTGMGDYGKRAKHILTGK